MTMKLRKGNRSAKYMHFT